MTRCLGWTLFLWLVCIVSTPVTFLNLLVVTFRFLEISRLFMLLRRILLPCNFTNSRQHCRTLGIWGQWRRKQRFPLQLASSIEFDCRRYWVLFGFEVYLEFFGDWFNYVPFTDAMSVFPRSNLNGVPLESEVNLSALVTDKAHQVAYFLFFRALAEWQIRSVDKIFPIKRIATTLKLLNNLFRLWGIFSPNLRILSRKNNEPTPFILFLAMTVTTNTSDRPNVSLVHG